MAQSLKWSDILAVWKQALMDVAAGKSYTISSNGNSRELTRNNLQEIMDTISYLESKVAHEKNPQDALGIVRISVN